MPRKVFARVERAVRKIRDSMELYEGLRKEIYIHV
jgi:hypothetical protein